MVCAHFGFKTLLPDAIQSPVITSFLYPNADFDFKSFYAAQGKGIRDLSARDFCRRTFHIGNIGDVYPEDFSKLIEVIKECSIDERFRENYGFSGQMLRYSKSYSPEYLSCILRVSRLYLQGTSAVHLGIPLPENVVGITIIGGESL